VYPTASPLEYNAIKAVLNDTPTFILLQYGGNASSWLLLRLKSVTRSSCSLSGFNKNPSADPNRTVRNSIAIAQRNLLSNDIRVDDYGELTAIVIDELFPMDKHKDSLIKEIASDEWLNKPTP
jgi:hypothetical protein